MNSKFNFTISHRLPSVDEFQKLRNSTGWSTLDDATVKKGLANSILGVCAIYENDIVGMGRIVGDNAIYFYIQDVIVLSQFQKKGIGKAIMDNIENYLTNNAPKNAFIGLMAANGTKEFYRSYLYSERHMESPGMFRTIK